MVSVVQQLDTGHEDSVHDAQMDYYGKRLATCSSDRTVKIFEVNPNGTHKLIASLRGHEGPVWQLSWSHPKHGNLLASCSYDKKVIIWKEESSDTWKKVYEHTTHESSVNSLEWAPHEFGCLLACASSDGSISIISCRDGSWEAKKVSGAHSVGCNAVSWCPAIPPNVSIFKAPPAEGDSDYKANLVKRLATAGCDNLVKIWKYVEDEEKWIEEQKLEVHSDWVRDVAWAPSIGLPKQYIASCSQDRKVIIWTNPGDGSTNHWSPQVLGQFDDIVWHVSWSTMGNILAVSVGDKQTSLWKENLDGKWVCISEVNPATSSSNRSQQVNQ